MVKIVIIDGQGGRMGSHLVDKIKQTGITSQVFAIGSNSIATAAMLRAGADFGATGENPVVVNSADADFILGPIGILSADSLLGEITPGMAVAVGRSHAHKILLPVNRCNCHVVGVVDSPLAVMIQQAVDVLTVLLAGKPEVPG